MLAEDIQRGVLVTQIVWVVCSLVSMWVSTLFWGAMSKAREGKTERHVAYENASLARGASLFPLLGNVLASAVSPDWYFRLFFAALACWSLYLYRKVLYYRNDELVAGDMAKHAAKVASEKAREEAFKSVLAENK